jgi:hypothetical protein
MTDLNPKYDPDKNLDGDKNGAPTGATGSAWPNPQNGGKK